MGENLGRGGQLFSLAVRQRDIIIINKIRGDGSTSWLLLQFFCSTYPAAHHRCWLLCLRSCSVTPAPSAPARLPSSPAPAAVWPDWPDRLLQPPAKGKTRPWEAGLTPNQTLQQKSLQEILCLIWENSHLWGNLCIFNVWQTASVRIHPLCHLLKSFTNS